jgi:hypothetical protein
MPLTLIGSIAMHSPSLAYCLDASLIAPITLAHIMPRCLNASRSSEALSFDAMRSSEALSFAINQA